MISSGSLDGTKYTFNASRCTFSAEAVWLSVVAAAVSPAAAPALLLSVVSSVLLPQPANVPMHIAAASKVAVNLFIIANFSSLQ